MQSSGQQRVAGHVRVSRWSVRVLAATACFLVVGCDSSSIAVEVSNTCSSAVNVYVGESNEVNLADPNALKFWAHELDLRGSILDAGAVQRFPVYDGAPGYVIVYGHSGADVRAEWRPTSDHAGKVLLSEASPPGDCVAELGDNRAR